jgi:apolipoprotein N-acyltransferase
VLVFREADVIYLAVLLVLAACAVNLQAALAHAKGLSYVVYAAGLAGVGLCWLLARAALPPAQLLAADLAVTAVVVFVGLLVASLLKQAKPDPADRVLVESGDRV